MSTRPSNNLVGASGEYFVCAELCRLGYVALLTPKNNPLFDVIASTEDGRNTLCIQVKTSSISNQQGWKFGKSMTTPRGDNSLYVVLVSLNADGMPDFYIYEHDTLAHIVENNYKTYLAKPKRDGGQRKDVDFRWHDRKEFTVEDHNRKDNWDPILNHLGFMAK